jgi:two-component system, NtrC family, nitrogen regulation sensor histidine kinase NtrY
VACSAATIATVAQTIGRRRVGARVAATALIGFCGLAALGQQALLRIERNWPAAETDLTHRSTAAMARALGAAANALEQSATRALDAPQSPARAFAWLAPLAHGSGDRGVVLYRAGIPVAWSGWVGAPIDSGSASITVVRSSFYVVLQATARRGADRAVATALLHADPPADRLADPLDAEIASATGVDSFAVLAQPVPVAADGAASDTVATLTVRGVSFVSLQAVPPRNDEARLHTAERATSQGALVIALALLAFVVAEWRPRTTIWWRRLVALAVPLAALAIVPLNAFSNASRWFDPTYFFSPVGGPYTASVGALGVTGAIVLLAALAAARARFHLRPRWLAATVAVVISVGALLALRYVAGGITPPGAAVPLSLWVGWQVALALGTTALLVGAAVAARGAMPAKGGLPPALAITMAVFAATLGPFLWTVGAQWPSWYGALWCATAIAAAFSRRARWGVVPPALVAALSSALIIWGTTAEKRVVLAERDLAGLAVPDPEAVTLLDRFGAELAADRPPASRADLLKAFSRSDLAAAAYPVRLAIWSPQVGERMSVALARFETDSAAVALAARTAHDHHIIVLTWISEYPGVQLVLAVPGAGSDVTTAVVAPQTRLITENAFATLVGLAPDATASPPYTISLLELVPRRFGARAPSDALDQGDAAGAKDSAVDSAAPPDTAPGAKAGISHRLGNDTPISPAVAGLAPVSWTRTGSSLHGDWLVPSNFGPARAHVEVPLRPFDALVQRAVLLAVLDLIAVLLLWAISAAGDGVLTRWLRAHAQRWMRSYRTRISVVLFTFFVVPAVLFAVWSYRRLRSDDAEERALLVWQTLRAAATGGLQELPADADRVGTPLFLYQGGVLDAASDSMFQELAPIGRFLRPDVELQLGLGNEVRVSRAQPLAGTGLLFGYRAVDAPTGARVVLAAPARHDETALDTDLESRRTDLGILVLFSVVLGAGAALWLSGRAARQLARPIDELRRAALAVAAGEREPNLAGDPPAEFAPVFAAFRRMAADFGESQRVLAWGEMARQVAHEIKNPLTPIRLGIQHLQRARAAGRRDFDDILNQNAGRILAEIDRLDRIARSFSRYGSGATERAPAEPTDLSPVVRDVVELERLDVGGGVQWDLHAIAGPVVVRARSDDVREVLLNVLENARLAGARRVKIQVAVDRGAVERGAPGVAREGVVRDGSGRASILVEDDGEGIPPNVLPRIFEPHFSTRTSGSGLGLAVSRRVVESWGGTITVQSQPGQGTRVTIVLLLVGS